MGLPQAARSHAGYGEDMLKRYDRKYIYKNLGELIENNQDKQGIDIFKEYYNALETCRSWERAIDCSVDGIFLADKDGVALYANRAYEEISGLKREEIEGVDLHDFVKNEYTTDALTLRCIQTKKPLTGESFFYRTGRKAMITCNPVFSKDNPDQLEFVMSNVRDLSEIEELREKYREEKERNDRFQQKMEVLRRQISENTVYIAKAETTLQTFGIARQVAGSDTTVLLTGETGVGKEVMAQYIHENSRRKDERFIKVNCGAIAPSLFESELFGYEKGAFTGANREGKKGLFEEANKGTIFLDEIGELPLDMQAKLLRVLQEREILRVGGTRPVKVDVRIITATNRDLAQMVKEKAFREDLFYRINVLPIRIPPLRERKEDIPELAKTFIDKLNRENGTDKHLNYESLRALTEYDWPGNIRELKNIVERSFIMSSGDAILIHDVGKMKTAEMLGEELSPDDKFLDLSVHLEQIEYRYIKSAYEMYGNVRDAAAHLNMKKSTFAGKMKQYREKYGA